MPLENGYYSVSGQHDKTYGLINDDRWVGVKVQDSYAEMVSVRGPRVFSIAREASGRPLLEMSTTCAGISAGSGGSIEILKPVKQAVPEFGKPAKTMKKKPKSKNTQVLLGDTDASEPKSEAYEDRLLGRLEKTIVDSLQRRRHHCTRCCRERTFAESDGDTMRCIVCTHAVYRADSHFSVIRGRGMYSPPPTKKAVNESPWKPGEDLPDDILPLIETIGLEEPEAEAPDAAAAAAAMAAGEGPAKMASRQAKLKQQAAVKSNAAQDRRATLDAAKQIQTELEPGGTTT